MSRVLEGSTLAKALAVDDAEADGDRALVHELAYGALRFLGQLRAILNALAHRAPTDKGIESLIWIALYQLIHTSAPAHAVVDCAVRATARVRRPAAKGLVNAVLRTFLRRRQALLSEIESDPEYGELFRVAEK